MNDVAQPSSRFGSEPIVVHVDAAFEPLLPKFMTNRRKEVATMTDALTQADFETIRKVAHGMKGVSGSYGFPEMTTVAARMEQAAKTGDAGSIRGDLTALAVYLDRVEVVYD